MNTPSNSVRKTTRKPFDMRAHDRKLEAETRRQADTVLNSLIETVLKNDYLAENIVSRWLAMHKEVRISEAFYKALKSAVIQ